MYSSQNEIDKNKDGTESSILESKESLLRFKSGYKKLKIILSGSNEFLIGRGDRCNIRLDKMISADGISREHAMITKTTAEDGKIVYQIKDMGSTSGTYVNGEKIGGDYRLLNHRDEIKFGQYLIFMFKQGLA
ncbi:MAG: FHA domain-containing protein [Planctomycetota bacterium]